MKMRNMEKWLMLVMLGISAGVTGAEVASDSRAAALARQSLAVQQAAGQAENLMREGNRLFLEDKYQEAVTRYIDAKALFERFNSEEYRRRVKSCDEQIRKCYYLLAEEAYKAADKSLEAKDYDEALKALRKAMELYPEGDARGKAKIAELERRKAAAVMREETNTEALLPGIENQKYQMEVLLRQGQELARAGRYAEAAQKFSSVLMIDPYHATALHDLKAVNIRSRKVAHSRYNAEHRKVVTEMEWRWAIPGIPGNVEETNETAIPVEKEEENTSELEKKIRSIILPEFKVEKCTIPTVVRALQEASRIYDPEKGTDARHGRGVNIFLRRPTKQDLLRAQAQAAEGGDGMPGEDAGMPAPEPAPAPAPAPGPGDDMGEGDGDGEDDGEEGEAGSDKNELTVTMNVRKRSLEWALRELCRTAKLRMRIDSHAVVLAPENVALDDMETMLFPVERSIFGDINVNDKKALKKFFTERDIRFPQGAEVAFVTLLSRLVVTNTVENLNEVEKLLQMLQENREPLVEITTKFMEVNQNNLKELGFQYSVNYNSTNAPYGANSTSQSSSHRLSFADAGSGLLRASETSANGSLIMLTGNAGGSEGLNYTVNVNALNQLSSADALASPRIITLPGVPAHIEMVRSVPFADEYDEGEINEDGGSSDNNNNFRTYTYMGPMPTFEDATDLGIIMDVKPDVDKATRKVTLQVNPLVRTHVGWTVWESTSSDGTVEMMRKPIFAERTIDTTVTVNDGKTIVLGGVVDDMSNVVDDKIPILGDLPLVGRFFQSRYTNAEKRHLLIFITCRLINPDGTPYMQEKRVANGLPFYGRLD